MDLARAWHLKVVGYMVIHGGNVATVEPLMWELMMTARLQFDEQSLDVNEC
jgi:hypothetical protein